MSRAFPKHDCHGSRFCQREPRTSFGGTVDARGGPVHNECPPAPSVPLPFAVTAGSHTGPRPYILTRTESPSPWWFLNARDRQLAQHPVVDLRRHRWIRLRGLDRKSVV